jgi:uncharacterized protein
VEKLSVPLSAITESGVIIDVTVPTGRLQPPDAAPVPVRTVRVEGTLQRVARARDDEYLFTGTVAGTYEHPCDRCLDGVSEAFEASVLWSFRAGGAAEEPFAEITDEELEQEELSTFGFEGSEIQLGPQVWEELVLNAPLKYLCSETCAGLCPRCGVNLNRDACACPKDAEVETMENTGLKELGKLFPNLRPKDTEE